MWNQICVLKDFSLAIIGKWIHKGRDKMGRQEDRSVSRQLQTAATLLPATGVQRGIVCNSQNLRRTQMPIDSR